MTAARAATVVIVLGAGLLGSCRRRLMLAEDRLWHDRVCEEGLAILCEWDL